MSALLSKTIFWTVLLLVLLGQYSSDAHGATAKFNYLLHCGGCHLTDGSGMDPEVPTLRNKLGPLTLSAEGRGYLVRVPGASQVPLTDEELRDVVNWVLAEYNENTLPESFRPITTEEVQKHRKNPLSDPLEYRKRFWPNETDQAHY